MKKYLTAWLLLLCMLLCVGCEKPGEDSPTETPSVTPSSEPTQGVVIDESALQLAVDFSKTYQTIDGFGAAYTWYSEYTFRTPYPEEILDLLFKDAGLTILRFKNEYNYPGFKNSAATNLKYYEYAKKCAEARGEEVKVLYTSWSPSADLKGNGIIDGGASIAKDTNGNYRYEDFAQWWVNSVKAYEEAGIPIDYVSIQNECDFVASYDGCEFSWTETDNLACYADAFLATYRAFQKNFGNELPLMIAPETMSVEISTLKSYLSKILQEEPNSIYAIAHHLYLGGTSTDDPNYCNYDSFLMNFLGVDTYATEHNLKRWQTEFYRGTSLQTANVINNSLIYENANAYIYWGGVWEGDRNDGLYSNNLISVGSGIQNWPGEHGYAASGDYYALRHFSEYIRPGYIRIDSTTGKMNVRCSTFKSPDGTRLVCVFLNNLETDSKIQLTLEDCEFASTKVIQSVFKDGFQASDVYQDKGALAADRTVTLPAESVTTVVIDLTAAK